MNALTKQELIEEGIKATLMGRKKNADFCVSLMMKMTKKEIQPKDINDILGAVGRATENKQLSLDLAKEKR